MCAIGRKIFHHSLEKISRAINTGHRQARYLPKRSTIWG
jgi:hypothetical protein